MLRNLLNYTAIDIYSRSFVPEHTPNKIIFSGHIGWFPLLVTINHDNSKPAIVMILYGSTTLGDMWNMIYTILHKEAYVNISGGNYNKPLEITFNDNTNSRMCNIQSLSSDISWKKTLKVEWIPLNNNASAIATEKKLLNIFKHIMFFSNKIYKYFIKRRIIICLDKLIFL